MEPDPLLVHCLCNIKCENYLPVFLENEIDFSCFKNLTKPELEKLVSGKLGPLKKIWTEIERIRRIDEQQDATRHKNNEQQISQVNPSPKETVVQSVSNPNSNAVIKSTSNQTVQPNSNSISKVKVATNPTSLPNSKSKEVKPLVTSTLSPESTAKKTPGSPNVRKKSTSGPTNRAVTIVGGVATAVVVGTVRKHVITNYTAPLLNSMTPDGFAPEKNGVGTPPIIGETQPDLFNDNSELDVDVFSNTSEDLIKDATTMSSRTFNEATHPAIDEEASFRYFGNPDLPAETTDTGIYPETEIEPEIIEEIEPEIESEMDLFGAVEDDGSESIVSSLVTNILGAFTSWNE